MNDDWKSTKDLERIQYERDLLLENHLIEMLKIDAEVSLPENDLVESGKRTKASDTAFRLLRERQQRIRRYERLGQTDYEWAGSRMALPPESWVVQDLIPGRCVTQLSAPGGAGKSMICLQLAAAYCLGIPEYFLTPDYELPKEAIDALVEKTKAIRANNPHYKKVVFGTYEDAGQHFERRLYNLADGLAGDGFLWLQQCMPIVQDLLVIRRMRGAMFGPPLGDHISTKADMLAEGEKFQDYCLQVGAELVIIDPQAAAFGGNANEQSSVYDFLGPYNDWAETYEKHVIFSAHTNRGGDFAGSEAWRGGPRAQLFINQVKAQIPYTGKDDNGKPVSKSKTEEVTVLSQGKINHGHNHSDLFLNKLLFGGFSEAATAAESFNSANAYTKYWKSQDAERRKFRMKGESNAKPKRAGRPKKGL